MSVNRSDDRELSLEQHRNNCRYYLINLEEDKTSADIHYEVNSI